MANAVVHGKQRSKILTMVERCTSLSIKKKVLVHILQMSHFLSHTVYGQVLGLNESKSGSAKNCIKAWDDRLDEKLVRGF